MGHIGNPALHKLKIEALLKRKLENFGIEVIINAESHFFSPFWCGTQSEPPKERRSRGFKNFTKFRDGYINVGYWTS